MKKSLLLIFFTVSGFLAYTQKEVLDPLATEYFSQSQIDTMSQQFIKAQNYLVRYSWNIYGRWDKGKDTVIAFNRDTIDIRHFLKARKQDKYSRIYDAYPGLVIELDSKNTVDIHVRHILSGNK
ncbi:MAG: hypothetical protein A2275_01095 [Bacteroidetes bacterium RIFOXYA12_FULL_35_11]|nr:MAG: hypothetical protein A2X01_03930 [Bacteroidetes bacterium GWF2_35_48]OFY78414.1 MAG: hypothetical protein A2275_01095 [Bacteroidetes bacterium RIFOXYA12_FULL_35_11]OFY91997.1 MAG: hypothetical protein A2309_01325 [Bacteroidetes bacterium RIFOXYB2_FULL_35_7]OFY93494.1 MAG: hypothetical protein A2491_10945 [Bacteroidetes bacterium RIFOXYC12_FULL_35_7]HBX50869.1 hypothetical protein [Bacteroidales bacterium]